MSLATDCAGFEGLGGLARYNPANGLFPTLQGLSALNLGPFRVPNSGDFSNIATPNLVMADCVDRLVLTVGSSVNLSYAMQPIPAPPYTIDFAGTCSGIMAVSSGFCQVGIGLSDGTKFWTLQAGSFNSIPRVLLEKWTNNTAVSVTPLSVGTLLDTQFHFLRITDDGTTLSAYISCNGKDYMLGFSEASNTFLTPTQWGVVTKNVTVAVTTDLLRAHVYNLAITNSILGDAP